MHNCSEASTSSQCDLLTGECQCQPGATGAKCDRCQAGFWNLGPNGCESCGCNTDFAVGGTCDQETGQCECLPGVVGQNCNRCPEGWVLVVNDTRAVKPEWKTFFEYEEGCFQCSDCVKVRSLVLLPPCQSCETKIHSWVTLNKDKILSLILIQDFDSTMHGYAWIFF